MFSQSLNQSSDLLIIWLELLICSRCGSLHTSLQRFSNCILCKLQLGSMLFEGSVYFGLKLIHITLFRLQVDVQLLLHDVLVVVHLQGAQHLAD